MLTQSAAMSKADTSIHVDFLDPETPVVSSVDVARHFQKKHKHVLDDIHRIQSICPKSFFGPNFRPVDYIDAKGEKRPSCLLTRDAFSLLVMGFTGAAALRWKLRYIEAFNCLEAAIRSNIRTEALEEARKLPPSEAALKRSYLDGMKEGKKLQKRQDGLEQLAKIKAYRDKGLTMAEIGRLLGVTRQAVSWRLCRARKLGLLPSAPVQGNLLETRQGRGAERHPREGGRA